MKFTKMHGLGNDYVYVNCFDERVTDAPALARAVSDRHRGIGGDGLILICPSPRAPVRMEMYNADGSRAQMCGNGIRCVAKYAYDHGLIARTPASLPPDTPAMADATRFVRDLISREHGQAAADRIGSVPDVPVETDAGVLTLTLFTLDNRAEAVCVDMGRPAFAPADMPATLDGERIVDTPLTFDGRSYRLTLVSMGNPHAVCFTDDLDGIDLADEGSRIENDPRFPERINIHFVRVESRRKLHMLAWERGSGATQACGTGACAAAVAAALTDRADRTCEVVLPGGPVGIGWADDDHVYMTGPATEVFTGDWLG
jgi:diaminopimelate epimerase